MREKRDLGNEFLGSLWWVLGNTKGLMKTRQHNEYMKVSQKRIL
jgi:hypothetical protein